MSISPDLITLAQYLAGEFDNQEQAIAEPVWFVHLRLWQRPVELFTKDSVTLFAEQANIINLDRPYRQRILRLMPHPEQEAGLYVQYYMLKNPSAFIGAGRNPDLLKTLALEELELLPGCILSVNQEKLAANSYQFTATQPPNARCTFTYLGNIVQVALGFKVTDSQLYTYDKGVDPETGKANWGAITGPYRYTKREQY